MLILVYVVYCYFLGIHLRMYDWTSGKGSRLGRQCAWLFDFLSLGCSFISRENTKKDHTRLSWACMFLFVFMFIYILIPVVDTACLHSSRFCQCQHSIHFFLHHPSQLKIITPKQHYSIPPPLQQSQSPQQALVQQPPLTPHFPTSSRQPRSHSPGSQLPPNLRRH